MPILAPPPKSASAPAALPAAARVTPDPVAEPAERPGYPTERQLRAAGLPRDGEPVSEDAFYRLPVSPAVRAEWIDGHVEYLPMPDERHQNVQWHLMDALRAAVRAAVIPAKVMFAGLRTRVTDTRHRDPDVQMLLDRNDPRRENRRWLGADLAVEVVSEDDPRRDYVTKRREYLAAGVLEYWIVDPRPRFRRITVLVRDGDAWRERVFTDGDTATGELVAGFAVDVTACLDADG